jgi:UDP-N-acetylglucosamine acyltransferase
VIHATAIIDASAEIADDVEIGAYSIIGPDVVIGEGCVIAPHVVIQGPTVLGKRNQVFSFASSSLRQCGKHLKKFAKPY